MSKSKIIAGIAAVSIIFYATSIYWSVEPDHFSPTQITEALTKNNADIAVGYYTRATLIKTIQT